MANILTPPEFNPVYTLYLNAAGNPVTRTLRDMIASEVIAAVEWQYAEANRLKREAEPFAALAEAAEAGTVDRPRSVEEAEYLRIAGSAIIQAGEAKVKLGRLISLVASNLMPGWRRHPGMGLPEVIRRFWPDGR